MSRRGSIPQRGRARRIVNALFWDDSLAYQLKFASSALFGMIFLVVGIVTATVGLMIFGPVLTIASGGLLFLAHKFRL